MIELFKNYLIQGRCDEGTGYLNSYMIPFPLSYGYTLKEIADYLRIHYTTVSKVIGKAEVNKK
jgi:hypothetical protein